MSQGKKTRACPSGRIGTLMTSRRHKFCITVVLAVALLGGALLPKTATAHLVVAHIVVPVSRDGPGMMTANVFVTGAPE